MNKIFSLNTLSDRKPGGSSEFQSIIQDGRESNVYSLNKKGFDVYRLMQKGTLE